jgi:hypothetical protein
VCVVPSQPTLNPTRFPPNHTCRLTRGADISGEFGGLYVLSFGRGILCCRFQVPQQHEPSNSADSCSIPRRGPRGCRNKRCVCLRTRISLGCRLGCGDMLPRAGSH